MRTSRLGYVKVCLNNFTQGKEIQVQQHQIDGLKVIPVFVRYEKLCKGKIFFTSLRVQI